MLQHILYFCIPTKYPYDNFLICSCACAKNVFIIRNAAQQYVTCSWFVIFTSHTTCSAKAALALTTHADRTFAHCYGSSFHGAVTASEGNMMKLPGWHLLSAAPQPTHNSASTPMTSSTAYLAVRSALPGILFPVTSLLSQWHPIKTESLLVACRLF